MAAASFGAWALVLAAVAATAAQQLVGDLAAMPADDVIRAVEQAQEADDEDQLLLLGVGDLRGLVAGGEDAAADAAGLGGAAGETLGGAAQAADRHAERAHSGWLFNSVRRLGSTILLSRQASWPTWATRPSASGAT